MMAISRKSLNKHHTCRRRKSAPTEARIRVGRGRSTADCQLMFPWEKSQLTDFMSKDSDGWVKPLGSKSDVIDDHYD
jgi:hypothetical protein